MTVRVRKWEENLETIFDIHSINAEAVRFSSSEHKIAEYQFKIIVFAGTERIEINIAHPERFIEKLTKLYRKVKRDMKRLEKRGYKVKIGI